MNPILTAALDACPVWLLRLISCAPALWVMAGVACAVGLVAWTAETLAKDEPR